MQNKYKARALFIASAAAMGAFALQGCSTSPAIGGSAAGSASAHAGSLEHCDSTMGTISIVEDRNSDWYHDLHYKYRLNSTIPLLRLMVQQSNCFVVVERGRGMRSMARERDLQNSGELRSGSRFHKGQLVAADYSLNPSINFSSNTGGLTGGVAGLLPSRFRGVGAAIGGLKFKQASTTLIMVDNRSGVQLAAAQGSSTSTDFNAWGTFFGHHAASLGGYSRTPEGKVIAAAFADAYNQMVISVRNYKAQEVKGGLGKGGRLKVSD